MSDAFLSKYVRPQPRCGGPPDAQSLTPFQKLGEVLGKGGWGTVYKAWDMESGYFIAAKQIELAKIPVSQLGNIMSEINLLQSLDHPQIVRYIESFKTELYLYIMMEYIENGSLESIVKKYGSVPENLLSRYIRQVLEGLNYLHNEGVIHMDIKAANILTTKTGNVKLADFGVAVRNDPNSKPESQPVGSPYWMAPEVIEMIHPTTKSDIWSLGCTIIELLTCHPPYSDYSSMGALFKMVQDDMPPIPQQVSPSLHDFLVKCFHKEPFLRSSASALLEHRWLRNAKTQMPATTEPIPQQLQNALMEYNKLLMERLHAGRACGKHNSSVEDVWDDMGWSSMESGSLEDLSSSDARTAASLAKPSTAEAAETTTACKSAAPQAETTSRSHYRSPQISFIRTSTSDKALDAQATTEGDPDDFDSAFTRSQLDATSLPLKSILDENLSRPWDENPSCLALLSADDLEDISCSEDSFPTSALRNQAIAANHEMSQIAAKIRSSMSSNEETVRMVRKIYELLQKVESPRQAMSATGALFYVELLQRCHTETTVLTFRLLSKLLTDASAAEHFAMASGYHELLVQTKNHGPPAVKAGVCNVIRTILHNENPACMKQFLAARGMETLARLLSVSEQSSIDKNIFPKALEALVTIVSRHQLIHIPKSDLYRIVAKANIISALTSAMLSLVYACSWNVEDAVSTHRLTSSNRTNLSLIMQSPDLILTISSLLREFSSGDSTVKESLAHPHNLRAILITMSPTKSKALPPDTTVNLSKVIAAVSMIPSTLSALQAAGAIRVIVDLIRMVIYPTDTEVVRSSQLIQMPQMEEATTHRMKPNARLSMVYDFISSLAPGQFSHNASLRMGSPVPKNTPSQAIGSSQEKQPKPSDSLQSRSESTLLRMASPMLLHLLSALYNLCRLDLPRQSQAVKFGILPMLQEMILVDNRAAKQFALPILFEMTRNTKFRSDIRKHDGVSFFIKMLKQPYPWKVQSMHILTQFIEDDGKRVAQIIIPQIPTIIQVVDTASEENLASILESTVQLIKRSHALCHAFANSRLWDLAINRLTHHNSAVRLRALDLIIWFVEQNDDIVVKIVDYGLMLILRSIACDAKVLVAKSAMEAYKVCQKALQKGGPKKK